MHSDSTLGFVVVLHSSEIKKLAKLCTKESHYVHIYSNYENISDDRQPDVEMEVKLLDDDKGEFTDVELS